MLRGLVAAHMKIEFVYYKIVSNIEKFVSVWGVSGVGRNVIERKLALNF